MAKGKTGKPKQEKSLEQALWDSFDRLRGAVEPAEYKHVVLSMIFLKYANDRFAAQRERMIAEGQQAFLEMTPFYTKDNVFFIPEAARWDFILAHAKEPGLDIKIDTALHEIETRNPTLSGALPDNYYSRLHIEPAALASIIDLINSVDLQKSPDKDVFGQVYEFCLRKFALKEGKGKGEFYTPETVVALLCELIEPYEGIVYDGACGSGGMFVQSKRFVEEHSGNSRNISIYGQEYTDTTRRLCRMNLAIRGISANLGEMAANTFHKDLHKDLKADFALENPPFNQKAWRTENQLLDDPRWSGYKVPPTGNANYAWLLNTLAKLNGDGIGAVLLANGSLSADGDEGEIRRQLIENDRVEAVLVLPRNLFYTTDISASVWILNRNKCARTATRNGETVRYRDRTGKVLFMDLRQIGHPYEKKYVELTPDDRARVTERFHAWQQETGAEYRNEPEFCYSAEIAEIREKGYSLVPSRYIEFVNRDEGADYDGKMSALRDELSGLLAAEEQSKRDLLAVLEGLGYGIGV